MRTERGHGSALTRCELDTNDKNTRGINSTKFAPIGEENKRRMYVSKMLQSWHDNGRESGGMIRGKREKNILIDGDFV